MAIEIVQGVYSFLKGKIEGVLPSINTDLAAKVTTATPPAFEVTLGEVASTTTPRIGIAFRSDEPSWAGRGEKTRHVSFEILVMVPEQADASESNYEMTRQVAADHLLTLFDDDAQVLNPRINAGDFGVITAMEAERGVVATTWPRKMPDEKTLSRGFSFPYHTLWAVKTR